MIDTLHKDRLDCDWVELIEEARELGLSIEDVRNFLNEQKREKSV